MTKKMDTSEVLDCDTLHERIDDLSRLVRERDKHQGIFNDAMRQAEGYAASIKALVARLDSEQQSLSHYNTLTDKAAEAIAEYSLIIARYIDHEYRESDEETAPTPAPTAADEPRESKCKKCEAIGDGGGIK